VKYWTAILTLGMLFAPTFALKADGGGRIPIYKAMTITQPGHYIVTRNLTAGSGAYTLDILSDYVVLDLGGHTIASSTTGVIRVNGPYQGTIIRNGFLNSGTFGIEGAGIPGGASQVTVENVVVSGPGDTGFKLIDFGLVVIRNCRIHNSVYGIQVSTATPSDYLKAIITENIIRDCTADGILLTNAQNSLVARNDISGFGVDPSTHGIHVTSTSGTGQGGTVVESNTLDGSSGGATSAGIRINESGDVGPKQCHSRLRVLTASSWKWTGIESREISSRTLVAQGFTSPERKRM